MATNQNGHLVDDAGNVVVEFVWGNMPMQPNDVRAENGGELLDYTLDSHNIVEDAWNGFPLYTPNDPGSQTSGVDYITVPNVLGMVATDASALLGDLELNTSIASAAANASKTVADLARTSGQASLRITTSATHGYVAGNKVTLDLEWDTHTLAGDFVVDSVTSTTRFYVTTEETFAVSATDNVSGLGTAVGVSGTVKAQSIAAGQKRAAGTAMTVTPWA